MELIKYYNTVYDILVAICGAKESIRDDFIYHHARSSEPCDEFRFIGDLGQGGKYYRRENRVSCYSEDENTVKRVKIDVTNDALADWAKTSGR